MKKGHLVLPHPMVTAEPLLGQCRSNAWRHHVNVMVPWKEQESQSSTLARTCWKKERDGNLKSLLTASKSPFTASCAAEPIIRTISST